MYIYSPVDVVGSRVISSQEDMVTVGPNIGTGMRGVEGGDMAVVTLLALYA
jgi:hypothetical protein